MRSRGRRVRRTAVLQAPSGPLVLICLSCLYVADKSTLNCFFPASQERFHVAVPDRAEIRSLQRNGVTAKKANSAWVYESNIAEEDLIPLNAAIL